MDYHVSIEELYEYNSRHTLVRCDVCETKTLASKVYPMKRVQDDIELIVCAHCMNTLKKGESK